MDQKLRRAERLRSMKRIGKVFSSGHTQQVGRFRINWTESPLHGPVPVRVLMTVPKKKFGSAVDRNLVRRRMREAYRKAKSELYILMRQRQVSIDLAVVYTGDHLPDFQEVSAHMHLIIKRLVDHYEESA